MIRVSFVMHADHDIIFFKRGLKNSGINSDDSAKSLKLMSHSLQTPQIIALLPSLTEK